MAAAEAAIAPIIFAMRYGSSMVLRILSHFVFSTSTAACAFAEIVRSGAIESPLMPHEESLAIMDCMDEIRYQIDLKYPFEDND